MLIKKYKCFHSFEVASTNVNYTGFVQLVCDEDIKKGHENDRRQSNSFSHELVVVEERVHRFTKIIY